MPNTVEDFMIADARKYLLPKLRDIVPVRSGALKRSLGVGMYEGKLKRYADNSNFFLVQRIELYLIRGASIPHTVVVGAIRGAENLTRGALRRTHPSIYGHILFSEGHAFVRHWLRITRQYERTFGERIERIVGTRLGLI